MPVIIVRYLGRGNPAEIYILSNVENWQTYLTYGFAHFGKSLVWYASELLFAYFLTELGGLTPEQMGMVLAMSLLASAPIEILTSLRLGGRLADARSAGGVQFVGAVLSSAALLAVFAGAFLPDHIRFAYSLLAGLGFRIGFALYDLPQNSLMALVPADSTGRIRFAAIRILLSGLATLTVAGTVGPLVAASREQEGSQFLLVIASLFGMIAITSAWHFARLLHRTTLPINIPNTSHRTATWGISFQRDFWLLICLMFVTSSFTPIFSKLEPYFAAYVLQSPFWGGGVVIAMALGLLIGQPVWLCGSGKVSPERLTLGAALLQLASLAGFWLSGSANPVPSVVCAFVFGLGNGGVGTMLWGLFSGTVARMEPRYTGISYGIFAAASRVASAASIFLVSLALAGIDFRVSDTLQILALMTALPAFGSVLIMLIGAGLLSHPSSGSFSKHS